MWRVNLTVKSFRKCSTLIELDRWAIRAIKEIEPLDIKIVDDELFLSTGLCRFLIDCFDPILD